MTQRKNIGLLAGLAVLLVTASGCSMVDRLQARDHLNRGVRLYTEKKFPESVAEFRKAIELDSELLAADLYQAHAYRAMYIPGIRRAENTENANLAIEGFKNVLEKDPGNVNAVASIAGIYFMMDDLAKAKEWHLKRIEIEPENKEPYYGIGSINQRLSNNKTGNQGSNVENLTEEEIAEANGYVDEGIEFLNKARGIDPNYADAIEYLNLLYREKSYLASEEEEKSRWEKEASRLALQVIKLRREQELEEEQKRREFFQSQDG